jgi:hypothetical protein
VLVNVHERLPQIKERNFDTDARKVRKKKDVSEEEDTVEKQIAGLADMIIADDETKRQEELVRILCCMSRMCDA